jgi:erythromycin esterase
VRGNVTMAGEPRMRFRLAVLSFSLAFWFAENASADGAKPTSADTDTRVAWLKSHTSALRSIDPADEDFSDLEPIRDAIGDRRIVQLSEQSHGDGATFHARTRLIKFLHQKCGFDVLAFESGLYDCRKAWELLREGKMSHCDAVANGVFDIWVSSQEVQPLIDYVGQQANGKHPLEICGFDCQFTAQASAKYLPAEIDAFLSKLPPDALSAENRATVVKGCQRLVKPGAGLDKAEEAAFTACRKALEAARPSPNLPADEVSFWRQFMESATAFGEAQPALKTRPAKIERSYGNIRDSQMAKNFLWLAQQAYPKRKIIVWAAAFHLMRNQKSVAMVVDPDGAATERTKVLPYLKVKTMGNDVWPVLGAETYSIFFTAAQGEFGMYRLAKPRKIPRPAPGSLEGYFVKAGCDNAFLDFRRAGPDGAWLKERLIARPLGYADYEADWTQVCDGLLFTRTMSRSTPLRVNVAPSAHPLSEAAQKELKQLQGTWRGVSVKQDGQELPLDGGLANLEVVIKGNDRTVKAGETVFSRAVFRMDPTATPKTVDVTITDGTFAGKTLLGVYELDGDSYRICLAKAGDPRPQTIASTPGSGHTATVLARAPRKSQPGSAPPSNRVSRARN